MNGRTIPAAATELQGLLHPQQQKLNSFQMARAVYRAEGLQAFYRGLGVCSIRAFIVNAVQVCPLLHPMSAFYQANVINSGRRTNG